MSDVSPVLTNFGSVVAGTVPFTPTRNRGFNVSIYGTFVGTVSLDRTQSSDGSVASATVLNAGTVYIPAQTITLGGTANNWAIAPVLTVATTQVVSATVNAVGSGGTPGIQTVTGTTGTGTKFTATVNVVAAGTVGSVIAITLGGSYTVNPTTLAAEPVTGGGLTGCTLAVVMGVGSVTVATAGHIAAGVGVQSATSGSGVGATFNLVLANVWRSVQTWTAPTESSVTETENGTKYRLNCTAYTSGSINTRIGQNF